MTSAGSRRNMRVASAVARAAWCGAGHPGRRHPARHRPRPLRRLPRPAQDRARHRPRGGADALTRRSRPRRRDGTHRGYPGRPGRPRSTIPNQQLRHGNRSFAGIIDCVPATGGHSFGWDHRVAGAPVPLHGVRLTDSDRRWALSSAPRRLSKGRLAGPADSGVHSRASEKPGCRCAAMLAFGWVLRCAVAIALKADREVQTRGRPVGATGWPGCPGQPAWRSQRPGWPASVGVGSDDPFQDGPLGRSWEAIPVGTGIRLGVERGAQVLGLDQLLDGVQRRPAPHPPWRR